MKNNYKTIKSQPSLVLILMMFMMLLVPQTMLKAQNVVAFTAGSLPTAIVPSGDAINFTVIVTNTQSSLIPAGWQLEVYLSSDKWHINSAAVGATPLAIDSRRGDTVVFVLPQISGLQQINVAVSTSPLCGIVSGEDRIFFRVFNAAGVAQSELFNAYPGGIANIFEPILSFTPQTSTTVRLHVDATRVHSITQTQLGAYARQIQVVHAADTNTIKLTGLRVSRNNSTWINVHDSLITRTETGFIYNFNTLLLTELGYTNNRLNVNDVIYFEETVRLASCLGNNSSVYTIRYGANGTFCATTTSGTAQLSVTFPAFSADVRTLAYVLPNRATGTEGIMRVQAVNNSTDPNAVMSDVLLPVFHGVGRGALGGYGLYRNTRAFLVTPAGALITGPGGATDTIFLPMTAYSGFTARDVSTGSNTTIANNAATQVINFENLGAATNAQIAHAVSVWGSSVVGLHDADGDGMYNDLLPGTQVTVDVRFVVDMTFHTTPCPVQLRAGTVRIAYFSWRNTCGDREMFNQDYTMSTAVGNSHVWVARFFFPPLVAATVEPADIEVGDQVVLRITEGISAGSANTGYFAQNDPAFYQHFVEITLPEGFEFVGASELNAIQVSLTGQTAIAHTVLPANIVSWDPTTRVIRFQYVGFAQFAADGKTFHVRVNVLPAAETAARPNRAHIAYIFRYGDDPATEWRHGCSNIPTIYSMIEKCDDFVLDGFTMQRSTFGFVSVTNQTPLSPAQQETTNRNIVFQRDNVTIEAAAHVTQNITQSATHQLRAVLHYTGANGAANRWFDVLEDAQIRVLRAGNNFMHTIPLSAITYSFVNDPVFSFYHGITVNMQSIGNLQVGDSVFLTLTVRSRNNIPNALSTAVANLSFQWNMVTNNVVPDCNRLLKTDLFLRNTNFVQISNPSNQAAYNIGAGIGPNANLFDYIVTSAGGLQLTGVEGRPNFRIISDTMVIRLQGLWKIHGLRNNAVGIPANFDLQEGTDFVVSYANDQTIITVNNASTLKNNGFSNMALGELTLGYLQPIIFGTQAQAVLPA